LQNAYYLPMNFLMTNYILDSSQHRVFPFLRTMFQKHSLQTFYRGFKTECIRLPLCTCIFLGVYGNLRSHWGSSQSSYVASATIAGMTLWGTTYPLDCWRTLMQTSKTKGYFRVLQNHVKKHGIFSLWRGLPIILLRVLPCYTMTMLAYEAARKCITQ